MQVKRFNWMKRPTTWEYVQAWRQHRSNMVQRFRDEATVAGTAFASTQNNLSLGLASLAAQASIQRAQQDIAAVGRQINLLA